ncbi:MAG: cytochrome c [Deltaproteobacteria bacterium]|nr:cytochrome c [Deltaproteobacteria bacterium]
MATLAGVALIMAVSLPASGADRESGKKVYAQKCQNCHGLDGKGSATAEKMLKTKIPDLTATQPSKFSKAERQRYEQRVRTVLAEGKKPMPPFGKSLSKEDQENVLEYMEKAFMNGGK